MSVERHPGSLSALADDQLATAAVSLVVGELEWAPDVAPATLDRIARDAVAYPEQFDRRRVPTVPRVQPRHEEPSTRRTVARLAVFGLILVVIIGLVAFAATASAEAADLEGLQVELVESAGGFEQPLLVTHAGDGSGTRYVVEQGGSIWAVDREGVRSESRFLDLRDAVSVSFEQGLLGLAFHPAFGDNGRFFVNYTRAGDGATVVSEFTVAGGVVDRDSERQLLVIDQPFANHNGGHVTFDAAGMLLIGTGDGGNGGDPLGSGQDPASLLGKLLRIDVDGDPPYGIPADNGFAGSADHRPEIHALGLRNPWRFSVDPVGGHIYIGDVGQGSFEEISVAPEGRGGQSFGWNAVEGPVCFTDGCDLEAHTPPAISYGRDEGCSVVGGHVYRGTEQPALAGVYVFGDFCSETIWGAKADDLVAGQAAAVPIGTIDGTLVSFGVDESGELYAVDQGGRILHVVTEAP
ncbi:MAG: PQQ-dependent sugar dehydrogenase [Candidatus Limnocylindrales bacterium]